MKLLSCIALHLTVVISVGSAFVLFPEDLSALLNVFYSAIPPIRLGMNLTKVGVGFRLGRNVDFQTLVEMGSLVTTSTSSPPRGSKRNAQPESTRTPNALANFIGTLWGRRPSAKAPTQETVQPTSTLGTVEPTTISGLPDQDVKDNEIDR